MIWGRNTTWENLNFSYVFSYVKCNLAVLDAFAVIVKVMNCTRWWDIRLAWYSPGVSGQICLYGLIVASWDSRIHRVYLCRRLRPPQQMSWYDNKQSDSEVPVMLEILGMCSTPSLLSLPGQLWPRVVAPDRVLLMGQIELFGI